jgi:hypothetical protein
MRVVFVIEVGCEGGEGQWWQHGWSWEECQRARRGAQRSAVRILVLLVGREPLTDPGRTGESYAR